MTILRPSASQAVAGLVFLALTVTVEAQTSVEGRAGYPEGLLPAIAYCDDAGFAAPDTEKTAWMAAGRGDRTGLQSAEAAGLTVADVPKLELRWAFAFPGATQARSHPTVIGETLYVGDPSGGVYAIDAASGCARWSYRTDSGVRGAILIGENDAGRTLAWFVDYRTNVYAIDTGDGRLVWRTRVGRHAQSSNTATPALHDGRLFVPISSSENVSARDPETPCCTSSGAVAAVDANTGELLWYHRIIADESAAVDEADEDGGDTGDAEDNQGGETAEPVDDAEDAENDEENRVIGPSGAPVRSSPTVDAGRGVIYVGTGENFTGPATDSSDAIIAVDMVTGAAVWRFQALANDVWNLACTDDGNGCPEDPGPAAGFDASPVLVARRDGKEILLAGQKSGDVWALDPDADGEVVWTTSIGKGGRFGGVHRGLAADAEKAYVPIADTASGRVADRKPEQLASPGLYALDLMNGTTVWRVAADPDSCFGRAGCVGAYSAAPAMIPGVVFSGGLDGFIRAFSARDGRLLWRFDTTGEYETVNVVSGRGGAIDGPAPVIANGQLYVNSGYGTNGRMPGNVLLAFGVRTASRKAEPAPEAL